NDPWWQFDRHVENYNRRMKPLILHVLESPNQEEAKESLKIYSKNVSAFVGDSDSTVRLLQSLSEKKISWFKNTEFVLLGLFLGILGGSFFLSTVFIQRPFLDVLKGTTAFSRGDLNYRIPVRRRDEMGILASSFNDMATALKSKVAEVQATRDLLNEVLGGIGCLVRIVDPKAHRVTFQSKSLQAIYPEGLKRHCYTILGRETACERCTSTEAIEKRKDFCKEEEAATGGVFYEIHSFPFPNPDGSITSAIEVIRDITARKKAEWEVQTSQNLVNEVLGSIGCFVRIVNPKTHKVIFQNRPLEAVYPQGLERHCYTLLGSETPCERCTSMEAIEKRKDFCKEEEAANGGVFYEIHSFPFPNPDGSITTAIEVIRDITSRKKMEGELEDSRMRLLESQKMVTVGNLTLGIAHHINNPLSGINMSADILLKEIDGAKECVHSEDLISHLRRIKEAGGRCEMVMKDLLNISRLPKLRKLPTHVNEAVEHALNVMVPQLELSKIKLVKELSDTAPKILGSRSQLETVFMNIISGAINEMPEGGTLTVRTEYLSSEDKVEVTIADTGRGINKNDLPSLFDPYFILKIRPSIKGTGLELSLAQLTVQSHGGTIEADSEEGKGTTFGVKLPACKETSPAGVGSRG
ncbi:MAG TPA: ATP-binding protein, partial [Candidatus Tripitaka californicus]|uniref:ATP-binding protein n=2 Tax=Candidatus Tripitaka californicus TaxID=3367616 RepID=UPI004024ECE0